MGIGCFITNLLFFLLTNFQRETSRLWLVDRVHHIGVTADPRNTPGKYGGAILHFRISRPKSLNQSHAAPSNNIVGKIEAVERKNLVKLKDRKWRNKNLGETKPWDNLEYSSSYFLKLRDLFNYSCETRTFFACSLGDCRHSKHNEHGYGRVRVILLVNSATINKNILIYTNFKYTSSFMRDQLFLRTVLYLIIWQRPTFHR